MSQRESTIYQILIALFKTAGIAPAEAIVVMRKLASDAEHYLLTGQDPNGDVPEPVNYAN